MRERRDGIDTNQCPRVDNERAALRMRIKSLIGFADDEVVVDYRGFGLGWSWHGIEVTQVDSRLLTSQSSDCQDGIHSAHGSHGSLKD